MGLSAGAMEAGALRGAAGAAAAALGDPGGPAGLAAPGALRELARAGRGAAAGGGAGAAPAGGVLPPGAWAGLLGVLGALLGRRAELPAGAAPAACDAVRALCERGRGVSEQAAAVPFGAPAPCAFAAEALRGRENMLAGVLLPLVHLAAGRGGSAAPAPLEEPLEDRVLALGALEDLLWVAGSGGVDLGPFLPGLVSGAARCLGEFGRSSSLVPLRARAEALAAALRVLGASLLVTHGGARDQAPPVAGGQDVVARLRHAAAATAGPGSERDGDDGAGRIRLVLAQALPGACRHPSAAVRRAAATALCWLVGGCSRSLHRSSSLFLDGLLQLCRDPAQAVHAPVRRVLLNLAIRSGADPPDKSPGVSQEVLSECFSEYARLLPLAARAGDVPGLADACGNTAALLQLWLRALAKGCLPPLAPQAVRQLLDGLQQTLSFTAQGARGRAAADVVGREGDDRLKQDMPRPPEGLEFLGAANTYGEVRLMCRALGMYILGEMSLGMGIGAQHVLGFSEECFAPLLSGATAAGGEEEVSLRNAALKAAAATSAVCEILAGSFEAATLPIYGAVAGCCVTAQGRSLFADLAADLVATWTSEELWDLSDVMGVSAAEGSREGALRLQTALAEGIGTLARCLPDEFRARATLLPSVLLPLLQRLGHPNAGQRQGAQAAVQSILTHCGFDSASHLVACYGNRALGILCQRLHLVELHPRAERGLVAALKLAAECPLPLLTRMLADPAALFVRQLGISGPARFRGVPVEHALHHIAALAEGDLQRQRTRLREIDLTEPDLVFAELQGLRAASRSCAGLAQGVLEAAVPFVLAAREEGRDARPAFLAWGAAVGALQTYSDVDATFEGGLPESARAAFAAKPSDEAVITVAQGAARVLPPLLAALAPGDVLSAEPGLQLLARLAAFSQAGELLRREFPRTVWPVIKEALDVYLAPSDDQDAKLGLGRRVRLEDAACAVLGAIGQLASVPHHGQAMFRDVTHPAAEVLASHLRVERHGPAIRAALKAALAALGRVDPDAVWLITVRALSQRPPLPAVPPGAPGAALRPISSLLPDVSVTALTPRA